MGIFNFCFCEDVHTVAYFQVELCWDLAVNYRGRPPQGDGRWWTSTSASSQKWQSNTCFALDDISLVMLEIKMLGQNGGGGHPGLAKAKPAKLKQLTGGCVPVGFSWWSIFTAWQCTVCGKWGFKSSLYKPVGHVTRHCPLVIYSHWVQPENLDQISWLDESNLQAGTWAWYSLVK